VSSLSGREGCPLSPGGVSSLSPGLERSGAVRCIPLDRVLECVCEYCCCIYLSQLGPPLASNRMMHRMSAIALESDWCG